jgi:hypothetical protein
MEYNNIFKKDNTGDKCTSKSFHELIEAFKKEGCPFCRVVSFSIDSYFESMLYESVNDPKVRSDLRKSLGYCKKHSIQLKKIVGKTYNNFGASIIIEDVTKELIKKLEKLSKLSLKELKKIVITNHNCPACFYQQSYENNYFSEILGNLENEDFFNKFLKNDGLCLNHLLCLLKMIKNSTIRNKIIENQKSKLTKINKDLNAFIKKHVWQNKEKITLDEANAFEKAIRKIVGD